MSPTLVGFKPPLNKLPLSPTLLEVYKETILYLMYFNVLREMLVSPAPQPQHHQVRSISSSNFYQILFNKFNSSELALNDILTPSNIAPLFLHPEIIPPLFSHLPPDLPVPPSPEALQRVIRYVYTHHHHLAFSTRHSLHNELSI
jgi:hypothetical protein